MQAPKSQCSVCEKSFQPRFRYQVQEHPSGFIYCCSQICLQSRLTASSECDSCRKTFALEFPYQAEVTEDGTTYACSVSCREVLDSAPKIEQVAPLRRLAVFNHKGGTGKTTTSVNLAAGFAEAGKRVLLIDADGQGNVGACLGIRGEQNLYHVLVHGADAQTAAVPVRPNLDVLTSNETLAAAEIYLAGQPNRDRILRDRLGDRVTGYDIVVVDCAPALSLMNQNVLRYVDAAVIPVSCDYLSLVGVKQVLRTLKHVRESLGHAVEIRGVLPTFFDSRNGIAKEALEALREHFKERCLSPIRVNTKLREAPRAKQTIFEYAPDSNGAADYQRAVSSLLSHGGEAQVPKPSPQIAVFRPPGRPSQLPLSASRAAS